MTEAQARELKRRYGRQLLALDEVSGVGLTAGGSAGPDDFALAVFLATPETPALRARLSDLLEGNEFIAVFAGKFRPHATSHPTA